MSFDRALQPLRMHPTPVLLVDPADGAIVDANPAASRFYGWTREQLRAMTVADINTLSPADIAVQLRRVANHATTQLHFRHRLADGSERLVEVHSGPVEMDGRALLCSIIVDETPRVEAEQALARRDRLYAMLSETNQRLIRARDRESLFTDVCRVAVEHGGFRFAWVGLVDGDGRVVPVARAGEDRGYVDAALATIHADDPRSTGPSSRAILTGQPVVVNDFFSDPTTAPWREQAAVARIRSAAALPLREDGRIVGAIMLYAAERAFFAAPELATLGETAADLSHGLDMLAGMLRRVRAEAQVAEWNERLEQYLESSPSISYVIEVTARGWFPEWVSANAEHMLRFSPSQMLEPDWWRSHVHPDDLAAAVAASAAVIRDGTARHEYRFLTGDGRVIWVLDSLRYTPGADGGFGRINGTWTDVTAQHRVRDRLRESEERLRLALSATGQGLWDLDLTTGEAHVADEYAAMLGYDPTAFRETTADWTARLHPDDVARVQAQVDDYLAGRRSDYRVEYRMRTAGGDWRWLLSVGSIVARDTSGRPLRMLGTHTDITAAKRAEDARRLLGSALAAAADAIVITDRNGTVEWANPAFTALTGYALEEAEGRNPREFLRSGVQSRDFYAKLWTTVLSGQVWRGELINKRKDGTLYPESLTITPVRDERGDIQHFIAIKRDLTEDRALRENLLQAQKMESVGRLAGGVAHDFNNLLTVINGSIELALANVSLDAPVRDDLLDIRQAADRAVALTRQLLAFSRRQILRRHLVDVPQLIADLSKLLRRLIGEDVTLVTDLPHTEARVLADATQLEQVVMNLVVNARDAMPRGGTLTLSTAEVTLDERTTAGHDDLVPGRYLRLSVRDTGLGMEPAIRERIFEPFFTTKTAGHGTGLGLSTVYGIVRQTGGVVTVESVVGAGSVFHVFLPLAADESGAMSASLTPRSAAPAVAEPKATRGTVLVVDDEPVLRRIGMKILERSGYRVLGAGNAEEAIAVFAEHGDGIDLLFTDVVMPGLSGPELAAMLLSRRPSLKVLFASGYTDDMVLRHGVDEATMEFLGKPYTLQELVGRVSSMLKA